ncbi:SDR family NAD(P)-dependent oxidoreductase [Dactylosporangium sp. CS-033363]|uniref:SDR family NAD(P)-dependent oxidoreductase n=1 Tax=Dactylosporangium sp. CS-033363 TaxID=3239935 RepID=UPI003D8CC7B4
MTVLLTGPTRGLGRVAALALAARHTDLILLGRPGPALDEVAAEARAAGATVHTVGADLARLADVRAAASSVRELLDSASVPPLRALIANAGLMSMDVRTASADGHELTFAVNHLAHAQLIGDLLGSIAAPGRIVLLGSDTYRAGGLKKLLGVRPAVWRDPAELARPAPAGAKVGVRDAAVAYATSKLAVLYYAHELQRRAGNGIGVSVFEPGWMPGTGLGRGAPAAFQALGRGLQRLPGMANPERSGRMLAAIAVDERWAGLRDGAYVVVDRVDEQPAWAHDPARELRLWEVTEGLFAPGPSTVDGDRVSPPRGA